MQYTEKCVSKKNATGFYVCHEKSKKVQLRGNIFHCREGGYISQIDVCNDVLDCPGNSDFSDEWNCVCSETQVFSYTDHCFLHCRNSVFLDHRYCMCSPLLYRSHAGQCLMYMCTCTPLTKHSNKVSTSGRDDDFIKCSNSFLLDRSMLNDLVVDCEKYVDDEPALISLLKREDFLFCENAGQIPCTEGHTKCYNISEICQYKINKFLHLTPCRNGDHLKNCGVYECNMMFKCPNSYCILWEYVCDSHWDCPTGIDESKLYCDHTSLCDQMFKCRGSYRVCIHLGHLCDGYENCPLKDDESFCELLDVNCPQYCHCVALAISCIQGKNVFGDIQFPFISLTLYFSRNFPVNKLFTKFPNVQYLQIRNLKYICGKILTKKLTLISVEYNLLTEITHQCF